jgi:hypothetical protein
MPVNEQAMMAADMIGFMEIGRLEGSQRVGLGPRNQARRLPAYCPEGWQSGLRAECPLTEGRADSNAAVR